MYSVFPKHVLVLITIFPRYALLPLIPYDYRGLCCSKQDQILLVKIGEYIPGFCVYRMPYLAQPPAIDNRGDRLIFLTQYLVNVLFLAQYLVYIIYYIIYTTVCPTRYLVPGMTPRNRQSRRSAYVSYTTPGIYLIYIYIIFQYI